MNCYRDKIFSIRKLFSGFSLFRDYQILHQTFRFSRISHPNVYSADASFFLHLPGGGVDGVACRTGGGVGGFSTTGSGVEGLGASSFGAFTSPLPAATKLDRWCQRQ